SATEDGDDGALEIHECVRVLAEKRRLLGKASGSKP
nr:hypothetical protein [Tanacetum cinerariifolium]